MEGFIYGLYELLHGQKVDPLWRDEIYVPSFVIMFFGALLFTLVFYYILNVVWATFNKLWIWFVVMAINLIVGLIAIVTVIIKAELNGGTTDAVLFLIINFLYIAIFFTLFSLIFKWFSPQGKRVPF